MAMSYYFPGTVLMGAGALELMPAEIDSLNVKQPLTMLLQMSHVK